MIAERSEAMGGGDPDGSAGGAGGEAPRGIAERSEAMGGGDPDGSAGGAGGEAPRGIARAVHERLTELFTEAIALPPAARAALVARVRSADAPLGEELAALLAADAAADGALHTGGLAPAALGALGSADASADTALQPSGTAPVALSGADAAEDTAVQAGEPGQGAATDRTVAGKRAAAQRPFGAPDVPGYRVLGVLGEGGMGTVYAAEQQSPRRPVAIKVLHARSQGALARFRAEAEIMARLDHPGIARVLEAGDADGHPFLVMEHVDGVTLDRHATPLPRDRRLALFAALCDAVHHAHVKGVIHRDLKPSNVMVRPGDRVVVLDFGVARLAAGDGPSGATQAGELIGTPLYMSPEQARLRPDEVDARSDVYTLGVMLYELVCGELPYAVRDLPLFAVPGVICDEPPVPLGKRDPDLRGDLEAIADRALRKAPDERYPSVAALGDDVRRTLDGRAVSVRTPGAIEQLRRFTRRRPLLAGGIVAAVIGTAAFAIAVTHLWLAADAAQRRTERMRAELEVRTDQLTLRQARAALARDPTEALAWLATLTGSPATRQALDVDAAWTIAEEALGRGVASHVLTGHTGEVHWIEPMPGSADFVTGAYDGRVIVWQAPGYPPRIVFQAEHGRVHVVRPSPDGARLAIGADGGALHIVTRDGAPVAALAGHTGNVQRMAWSPDGAWLATGDDRGGVWLWPRGGAPGRKLQQSKVAISALAFSADSTTLVGGDHTGALWLWRPGEDAITTPATAPDGQDTIDTWTDGQRVVAVDGGGTVRTWRIDGGALVREREVATGQPTKRAMFSTAGATAGAWVVLGTVSGEAIRVDGEAIEVIATHHAQVRYLAITADGRRIATASDDGVLQVTDRATGRSLVLRGHAARIRHVEIASTALLSADGEGVVRRWDLDAAASSVLDGTGAPVERMAASPDGAHLATIDSAGKVAVWPLGDRAHPGRDGDRQAAVGQAAGHPSAIAIAGGAPIAITGSAEGEVVWWRATPVRRTVNGIVRALAASADRVAVATSAGPIALFTADGEPVAELAGNTGGTEAIAFDPRGGLLAAGGQDRVIRVYRAGAPAQVAELPGPTGDTHFVMFSPGGDRLFAAGNDGVVHSWPVRGDRVDPAGHTVVAHHAGAVSALAVSFDGRWLASAARDDLVMRRALGDGRADTLATGGAASAIAFDALGGLRAVTRTGAVVHAAIGSVATLIDHGARAGVAVYPDRLAIALDDGAIAIEMLGPHTFDQLAALLARATTYRLPAR